MRIRYDSRGEGVDVAGDRQGLIGLAEVVLAGCGTLDAVTSSTDRPEADYLRGAAVENGEGLVTIAVNDRRFLAIRGGQEARAVLAENLRDIAGMDEGGHGHFEYFEGHVFLAPGSLPMVVNSPHGGMPS